MPPLYLHRCFAGVCSIFSSHELCHRYNFHALVPIKSHNYTFTMSLLRRVLHLNDDVSSHGDVKPLTEEQWSRINDVRDKRLKQP